MPHFQSPAAGLNILQERMCSKPLPEQWLNEHMQRLRHDCRRAERRWKKDGLYVSLHILRDCLSVYQEAVQTAKTQFISNLMSTNRHKPQVPSCKPSNLHSCCYPFATNNSWHLSPATLPWPPLFSTSFVPCPLLWKYFWLTEEKIKLFCLFKNNSKTRCDKKRISS